MTGAPGWSGPQNRLSLSSAAWRMLREVYADQMSSVPWKLRAAYRFMGGYLSMLERKQMPALQRPPLFIVGHWRSGTTFLHELMVSDPQFCFPSTYACMNPQHFLLTERGAEQLSGNVEVARPMDAMKISSASPQEDEFALLCLGARSPYEAVLFPNALRRALESGDFEKLPPAAQQQWRELMTRFAGQVGSRHPDKALLLKSPPHGWRIKAVRQLFPGARFIHIVRNPFDVAASTRRMWETLFGVYALTPPPYADVMPDVAEFQGRLLQSTEADLEGAADACIVRFEDLTAEPHRELERIYSTLKLGSYETVRSSFAAQLQKTSGHQKNVLKMSPADRALVQRWSEPLLRKYRYD